jgi:hypothetical protein
VVADFRFLVALQVAYLMVQQVAQSDLVFAQLVLLVAVCYPTDLVVAHLD